MGKKYQKKNINCLECGDNIEHLKSRRKYCSDKCKNEFNCIRIRNTQRKRYREEIKPLRIVFEEKRKCNECYKEFIWTSSSPQKMYCSKVCGKISSKNKYKKLMEGIININGKSYNYHKLRFEIFKRDNFACQYCGRNVKEDKIKLHCDHIKPKSKGGLFIANNLTTSCEECNLGKRDILLEKRQLNQIIVKNE